MKKFPFFYESVDDSSLSYAISQKQTKKVLVQQRVNLMTIRNTEYAHILNVTLNIFNSSYYIEPHQNKHKNGEKSKPYYIQNYNLIILTNNFTVNGM